MPVLVAGERPTRAALAHQHDAGGDGSFRLYLAAPVRKASGNAGGATGGGDACTTPRNAAGPQTKCQRVLAELLEADGDARARWEGYAPSVRKEVLRHLGA